MLFQAPPIDEREAEVIEAIDAIRKELGHGLPVPGQWRGRPWRATHARAMQGSASLDGQAVAFADAIAAADDDEPPAAGADAWAAVPGYRAALTCVLQLAGDPAFTYDDGILRGLHYMMTSHDLSANPGRWRRSSVSVRREPSGELVYQGPEPRMVPALMAELIASLNAADDSPPMIRAAMAHLNLAAIHPFSDGNGRMARALQTLVLARSGVSAPPFSCIEEYVSANSADYETALSAVDGGRWRPERDARPWIRFCLTAHFHQATTLRRRTAEYDRLWDELEREVERRGLPERVVSALADAAIGRRVRSPLYRSAAGVSARLANRDLKRLVEEGLLVEASEPRGPWYLAADPLKAMRTRTREPRVRDDDPFPALLEPSRHERERAGAHLSSQTSCMRP